MMEIYQNSILAPLSYASDSSGTQDFRGKRALVQECQKNVDKKNIRLNILKILKF